MASSFAPAPFEPEDEDHEYPPALEIALTGRAIRLTGHASDARRLPRPAPPHPGDEHPPRPEPDGPPPPLRRRPAHRAPARRRLHGPRRARGLRRPLAPHG